MISILDALRDPQMRHAALVHMPIALSMLAIPVAGIAALRMGRARAWRWATFVVYAALLVLVLLAVNSGEGAHDAIDVELPAAAYEIIEEHEELAEKAWMFAAGVLVLTAVTFIKRKPAQGVGAWLALLVSLGGAGWIGITAHHGGTAVYEWGVGIGASDTIESAVEHTDPRAVFFVEQVRPVLEAHCWRCHNGSKRKGRLDQTTMAGLLEGGISGPALVPGAPQQSLMIEAVYGLSEDFVMPPDEPLSAEQIAVLETWIRDGAVWVD